MLGILCGLESEAAIARRVPNALVACAGARPQKARWLARELIQKGATKLLSFGVAGGLEPGLPVGTLVLGTQVASRDGTWACDTDWLNALSQKLPAAHCGGVWGSEIIVPNAMAKRSLYEKSRCLIVDMESQCVAQIATEAKIPFGIMRTVCDTFDMEMPPVVIAAINEDGSTNYKRALFELARHPLQLPSLLYVGKGIAKGLKELKKAISTIE